MRLSAEKLLQPETRHASTVRKKSPHASYVILGDDSIQHLHNQPKMLDLEHRQKIQDSIASYRELKYKKEQARISEEASLVEQ